MPDQENPAFDIEGSLISPNIGNYYIGKGEVFIQLLGEDEFTPVGNCPHLSSTPRSLSLTTFRP